MANWAKGKYVPKNAHKYIGNNTPIYRSGWELTFMIFCDTHDNILYWASEPLKIPYKNPFTGKPTVYIPDFFVVYQNKYGKQMAEVVEIKPKKQSLIESKASSKDRMVVALNHAKWNAANSFCRQHGYGFRVVTEDQLFHNGRT